MVTFLVDYHPGREVVLGCDGRTLTSRLLCVFACTLVLLWMKECCVISQNVGIASKHNIKVWRGSERNKRGKKRRLAASASIAFGEMLDKVSASPRGIQSRLVHSLWIVV